LGEGFQTSDFCSRVSEMGNALKKMEDEALKLPARSRARLAERLIASLEKVVDSEAESEWFAEVERRSAELAGGKIKGVPANKVFKKARTALR
jgi:putative addiction module component (TIGR02574 family)